MDNATNLTILLEWADNRFTGQIKTPAFFFASEGDSVAEVTENIRKLIEDYLSHEGSVSREWKLVNLSDITFEYAYKLGAFFEHFKEIKISAIAGKAGLNTNLVQQYVSGNKKASQAQAKKLELAVHDLARELGRVSLA